MEVYWLEQSDAETPLENDWLSPAEHTVFERLNVPKRRSEWRLGRWTAKRAAAGLLRLPQDPRTLARIVVRPENSGAPAVYLGERPAELRISLSHSHGLALCCVSNAAAQLGCDIERAEPRSDAFLSDYLTEAEQRFVSEAAAHPGLAATLLWSAKESALKALQIGLRADTLSVTAVPEGELFPNTAGWNSLVAYTEGAALHGWWRAARGFIRTVVASPPPRQPVPQHP